MVFYVIYFLARAIVKYCVTKDSAVFFYHELVTYDLNAIHVSVYVTLAFYYFYTQPNRSILASAFCYQETCSMAEKKEIYTYEAPWLIYALSWSIRPVRRPFLERPVALVV